jgi:hypothetical protein
MRARTWLVILLLAGAVAGGLAIAALVAWPNARLEPAGQALAGVELPGFAGHPAAVVVKAPGGKRVPVKLVGDRLWPVGKLASGQRLTVELTVRRPSWASWLVGKTETRVFAVKTPSTRLRSRWVQVPDGGIVTVAFDRPVGVVTVGGRRQVLARPRKLVPLGVVASGGRRAGAIAVSAAARSWERLPAPVSVHWFPKRPYPQLLSRPTPGGAIAPGGRITLGFSAPVHSVLGSSLPQLSPPTSGRWLRPDAHTLVFSPSDLGYGLGEEVGVVLPRAVHLTGPGSGAATRTLRWQVPEGSIVRLHQLLAQLGYLPVGWEPADDPGSSPQAQLEAAVVPPPGQFTWRYANTPPELQALWSPRVITEITRGAVMMFEDTHGLDVDAIAGPKVWRALMADAVAGKRRSDPYSYVFVHRSLPQSLNLWVGGSVIVSSPGNTGVPQAPTQLGTFPVFEHIPVGTMSGTNPDGTHYNDPGIRYISYFNHGDAIHAFTRASFGTPQSLGCVELPLAAAAEVWPHTPIGTLVTIEN